jgi:hypothetical protein
MRRLLAWLVCVPIIAAATQVAHAAGYRLVAPDPAARAELLHHTGHGYLSALSFALGIGWAAVLIGFATLAFQAARGRVSVRPSAMPFALLGPVTFVLQEHIERLIHDGSFPVRAVLEPTFGIGLALQVPFALAAFLVARLLLRAAECLGRILSPGARPARPHARRSLPRPAARDPFRPLHLHAGLGIVRGPPVPLPV